MQRGAIVSSLVEAWSSLECCLCSRSNYCMQDYVPTISFQFRYADALDAFLMITGTLLATAVGVAMPVSIYYYGQVITEFVVHQQIRNSNASTVSINGTSNDSTAACYATVLAKSRYAKRHF